MVYQQLIDMFCPKPEIVTSDNCNSANFYETFFYSMTILTTVQVIKQAVMFFRRNNLKNNLYFNFVQLKPRNNDKSTDTDDDSISSESGSEIDAEETQSEPAPKTESHNYIRQMFTP